MADELRRDRRAGADRRDAEVGAPRGHLTRGGFERIVEASLLMPRGGNTVKVLVRAAS